MKIGFISRKPLDDKRSWSGTIHVLADTITKKYEVEPIIVKRNLFDEALKYAGRKLFAGSLKGVHFFHWLERLILLRKIEKSNCDVLFCPINSGLIAYGKIPADKKLIYLSDATYHAMLDYYFFNETKRDQRIGNYDEKSALNRADAVILSNHWAKNDAVEYYKINPEKISVLPFGANLEDKYSEKDYDKNKTKYKLLLVGVDWIRKGIDLAVECVEHLNAVSEKYTFELTIVGFEGKEDFHDNICFKGRLNKNIPEDMEKIIQCYQESDIFILPTKAECSSIAWCEANMYGLPIFTHRTGGSDDYVVDRVNGRCLPLGATGKDFAESILEAIENEDLQKYSAAAREKYEKELNWNHWLNSFDEIIDRVTSK